MTTPLVCGVDGGSHDRAATGLALPGGFGSTGSNRSTASCLTVVQPAKVASLDTAGHVGDLGCDEDLGSADLSSDHEAAEEPQVQQEQSQRQAPSGSLSFTFGALGSPLGSPVKPPGFYSPAPPCSPAKLQLSSPGRPVGLASPRSVRLTGSVRLIGDTVLSLPPGVCVPAEPAEQPLPSQLPARQLPLAGSSLLDTELKALQARFAREPSFGHLLLQPPRPQAQQPSQAHQAQGEVERETVQPEHPPLKKLLLERPPAQQPRSQQQHQQQQGAGRPPLHPRPPAPGGHEPVPVISPRKRARKSLPARAACDEADLPCALLPILGGDDVWL